MKNQNKFGILHPGQLYIVISDLPEAQIFPHWQRKFSTLSPGNAFFLSLHMTFLNHQRASRGRQAQIPEIPGLPPTG